MEPKDVDARAATCIHNRVSHIRFYEFNNFLPGQSLNFLLSECEATVEVKVRQTFACSDGPSLFPFCGVSHLVLILALTQSSLLMPDDSCGRGTLAVDVYALQQPRAGGNSAFWSRREDLNAPSTDYNSDALRLSYTGSSLLIRRGQEARIYCTRFCLRAYQACLRFRYFVSKAGGMHPTSPR